MQRIAIFASGNGSNAVKIIEHFKGHSNMDVALILSNKSTAAIVEKAEALGVETLCFNRNDFYEDEVVVETLKQKSIDLIVLAGFLWLIPNTLIKAFENRILNIHPALLPKFGGKGMYGMNVHRAIIESGEKESGITIHLVNEEYDKGQILFQEKCSVESTDGAEDVAKKVQRLEHQHFANQIELYLMSLI